jgi:predicted alpha/beta-hydrolase family hydrolase
VTVIDLDTPHGPARAHLHPAAGDAHGALVLGHGAGGGVTAPDLQAATRAATAAGVSVALVEQPYRVAGRRSPAPAGRLDTAWTAVVEQLCDGDLRGLPLVTGGRSSGARVACRTAQATGASGVVCLAFPVHPPGRPEKTRLPELDAAGVPVLVIQGESDPFGMPPEGPDRRVVVLAGDHGLKKEHARLGEALTEWLGQVLRGTQVR